MTTITDELTDRQFTEFFAQRTDDDESVATFCNIDDDFDYASSSFEQAVANIIYAVFGGGPDRLPALVSAPAGCTFQFDLLADGEGLMDGGRYLLNPPALSELPILASPFVETRHMIENRNLVGLAAAISIARTAHDVYRVLVASYERINREQQ